MRKLFVFVIALSTVVGVSTAQADPITTFHLHNWDGSDDETFTDSAPPQWSHLISFTPEAASITNATLELRHKGNIGSSFFGEVWALSTQGNFNLGELSNSNFFVDFYTTQTFNLPASLFPALPATNWMLALKLSESTGGSDQITLDWAKLSVTYEPVAATQTPEPATLTLIGTGFAAAMWRRRRQRRQHTI
jgi:PEP-CTERM motif